MRTTSEEHSGVKLKSMDKWVLMLVRRMLRHVLRVFKQTKWSAELIGAFNKSMQTIVLSEKPKSRGLTMHYLEIFFEELAKEADGDITAAQVNTFLLPFVTYVATQLDGHLLAQCRAKVLHHLVHQSDLGRSYSKKYNAWKRMGFPTASIDDFESPEKETFSLGPLVGIVDCELPVLPLNADCVLDELQNLIGSSKINRNRRKILGDLLKLYETYKSGEFPFGVRTRPTVVDQNEETATPKANQESDNARDVALKREISVPSVNREKKKLLQTDSGERGEILLPELQHIKIETISVPSSINDEVELVNEQLEPRIKTAGLPDKETLLTSQQAELGGQQHVAISRRHLFLLNKFNLLETANWLDNHFGITQPRVSGERANTACAVEQAAELRNENGEPKAKKTKVEQHNAKNPVQAELKAKTQEGGQPDPKNDVQPQTTAAAKASEASLKHGNLGKISEPPRKQAKKTNKPGLATPKPPKGVKIKIEPNW
ncbi:hypothetical protein KR059_006122 [Drosophila kikkawai]|nr:hypothetical protein KR059_006122 [Drosophila kikkawai]